MRQGRTVALNEHAKTHIEARQVIPRLAEHYRNDLRVKISGIDNTRGKGNAVEVALDVLPKIDDTQQVLQEK